MLTSKITRLKLRTVTWGILFAAAVGWVSFSCIPLSGADPANAPDRSSLRLIQPEKRTITERSIGQESFVEPYERTSIYPKLTGYIEKWKVDIGDKVKKGDVLATLMAPDLNQDWETKKAQVKLAEGRVELANKALKVKQAAVKTAEARLAAAKTMLKTNPPSRDAAEAAVAVAEAELLEKQAVAAQAESAIKIANAQRTAALSEAKRLEVWLGYLTLTAPYDGVIVARNANTAEYVLPRQGYPTDRSSDVPHRSSDEPIYVIYRTDIVRVAVYIHEEDAPAVQVGTKATVKVPAYRDKPISATVTRTSWALDPKFRTLRAEIDLPNPKGEILTGMNAYGKVHIKRSRDLWTLPLDALDEIGNKLIYWEYKNGRAIRRQVQTGTRVGAGEWMIEVTKRLSPGPRGKSEWVPIDGSEKVIVGDLSLLADGKAVKIPATPSSP